METGVASVERSRVGAIGFRVLLLAGAVFCVMALAARILTLNVATFDMDEFIFALEAKDVLHGKLPYAGVFDDKPVGLTYVFALAEWLGNTSLASIHVVGLLSVGLAGCLIYAFGRELRLRSATCLAIAGLFGLEVLLLGGWASMSELVAAPLICAANLAMARGPPAGLKIYALLGLLFGTVGQISYLALPGLALSALGLMAPAAIGESVRRACAIGAGFAVATILLWLPQILTSDWLPYVEDQLYFYRHYRAPAGSFPQFLAGFLAPALDICLPVLVVTVWTAIGRDRRRPLHAAVWPITLQLIGTLVSAWASNRYYPHYLILCLPSLAALTALFLAAGPASRETKVNVVLLYWAAVAAVICARSLPERLNNPGMEKKAAQLIDRLVGPGRRVFVFDEAPAIYYLSRSEIVGRYVIPNHYLPSCSSSVEMTSTGDYIAQTLRARPDLILSGSICPTDLDSDGLFKRAGYVKIAKVSDGSREIDAYAPQGACLAASTRAMAAGPMFTASC